MRLLFVGFRNENLPMTEQELKDATQISNWHEKYQKEGKIENWSFFGLRRGCYGVWNVNSVDELHKILNTAPFAPYATWEVYPLVSVETHNSTLKEIETQMAGRVPVGAAR